MAQTKVVYYIGDEDTPYLVKVPVARESITLTDFKKCINKSNYKFFFQSYDEDFGLVKEEISDNVAKLPQTQEGKIVCFLTACEKEPEKTRPTPPERVDSVRNRNEFMAPPPPRSHGSGSSGSRRARRPPPMADRFGSQSTIKSSELSDRTGFDSEFDDASSHAYSTVTDMSSVSRQRRPKRQVRRKKRVIKMDDTTSNYSSSVTDSTMSLNVMTVDLDLEKHKFLGISIVGQNNESGDGGIYIGSIMKGGAVAADGRIEAGDMLLQVNDVNFEEMTNNEAVDFLRKVVNDPSKKITLMIAKCWDPSPTQNHYSLPRNNLNEPIRPIDPAAWVASQQNFDMRYNSMSQLTETSSDTFASSLPEADQMHYPHFNRHQLTIHSEMSTIVRMMRFPNSGLEIKDRQWLKITIPLAFIGSELVDWLHSKVEGLQDRRDARKYASSLVKNCYIKHTVNKASFSEQCYYVFGDQNNVPSLPREMVNMSLTDSNSDVSTDTCRSLGVLPRARPSTPNHYYGHQDYDTMSIASSSVMSSVSQMSVRDRIVAQVGAAQRQKQMEDDNISLSSASTISRVRSAIV